MGLIKIITNDWYGTIITFIGEDKMKKWVLVGTAAFVLASCRSANSEEAIWDKHDYYMDSSVAYQKAFEFKMEALGKDRTEEGYR